MGGMRQQLDGVLRKMPHILSENSALFVAALCIFVSVEFMLHLKRKSRVPSEHQGKKTPPFALGSNRETLFALFGKDAPWFFLTNAQAVGNIYLLRTSFGSTTTAICDYKVGRHILDDDGATKPFWAYGFANSAAGGDNLFSANGYRWSHARKSVAAAFSPFNVKQMKVACQRIVEKWVDTTLEAKILSRQAIDVMYEMQRISIRVIVEAGFEYEMSDQEIDIVVKAFDDVYLAQKKMLNPIRVWFPWLFSENRAAQRGTAELQMIGRRIIDSYRSNHSSSSGNVTAVSLIDKNEKYISDDERVRDMLVFIAAGYDSTAATLAWTLLELARNPSEQKLLRDDLRNEGSKGQVSSVLKRVIRESMRLNPIAAFGPIRTLSKDVPAGPYLLPSGSCAIVSIFAIHRNPAVFNNPDLFQPNRWINPTDAALKSMMPYGAGRRNCIGRSLADAEIETVLSKLCGEYEFSVQEEGTHDHWVILKPEGTLLTAKRV